MKQGVALWLTLQTAGCSFFVPSPSHAPPEERHNCGARGVWPVIDTIAAVAWVGGGATLIVLDQRYGGGFYRGYVTLYAGLPSVVIGLLYAVSAAYGYHLKGKCEQHNASVDRTMPGEVAQPGEPEPRAEPEPPR